MCKSKDLERAEKECITVRKYRNEGIKPVPQLSQVIVFQ